MKKTLLLSVICATLFACSTPEEKKETSETGTATAAGSVTTTGPEVDLMKKAQNAWAAGDWDTYLSCYADTARSVHNGWASNDTTVAKKMSSFIDQFKKSRELMDGNVTVENTIYEVVTMADGSQYGHAWANLSWKTKKGVVSKSVIFNSYGIKDGKLTYEWPIYDSKPFTDLTK
ncbi:MAG: hypothetical protein RI940_1592 [Bacteroidota bacterium]|jgi:hypothetical protein